MRFLYITLTDPILDALDNTPFGIEHPEELRIAKYSSLRRDGGQPAVMTKAAALLLTSLKQCQTAALRASSRRALEERISEVTSWLASEERTAKAFDNYEGARGWGEAALDVLSIDIEDRIPEQLEAIQRWAEYDPDVREHVTKVRDAIAHAQNAVAELKATVERGRGSR